MNGLCTTRDIINLLCLWSHIQTDPIIYYPQSLTESKNGQMFERALKINTIFIVLTSELHCIQLTKLQQKSRWEMVNVVFRGNFGPQIRRMRLKKKVQIEYSMYQMIHVDKLGTSRELSLLWYVVDCWQTKKIYNIEKMTTLTVCNRIESGKSEKVKLNSINFKSSVQNLKDGISKRIKRPVSDFGE